MAKSEFYAVSNMWCVARFGINHYLACAWSFERMRMHVNAFFYLYVVFIRLHELAWHSNVSIKWQTFECHWNGQALTISWRLNVASWFHSIMRIAMQCHPSLYYVMYLGTLLFAVQFNVFISLLFTIFFSDAAYNEYS